MGLFCPSHDRCCSGSQLERLNGEEQGQSSDKSRCGAGANQKDVQRTASVNHDFEHHLHVILVTTAIVAAEGLLPR